MKLNINNRILLVIVKMFFSVCLGLLALSLMHHYLGLKDIENLYIILIGLSCFFLIGINNWGEK